MLPSTSSCLRQGPTHVTDTGRCPMPCLNPTEVAQLGQLSLCCSRSGVSPSSQACSVLSPALRLSRTAVCAATELSVHCSQDPSDLRTISVLRPDRQGEPVVTRRSIMRVTGAAVDQAPSTAFLTTFLSGDMKPFRQRVREGVTTVTEPTPIRPIPTCLRPSRVI